MHVNRDRVTQVAFHHRPSLSLSMGQGKFIPENIQWIVIRLASTMSLEDTAMFTDVSASSIRRILAHFNETGNVITSKRTKTQAAQALCDLDIQVWHVLYMMGICYSWFVSTCNPCSLIHLICILMNCVSSYRKFAGFQYRYQPSGGH
jgi:hypothetical protein